MPFCWASGNVGQAALDYTVQAQLETVLLYRSHPSVVAWSLGNESPWTANFAMSLSVRVWRACVCTCFICSPRATDYLAGWLAAWLAAQEYVREADNTRPFMFDGGSGAEAIVDIYTQHYPPLGFDPAPFVTNTHPTLFGEYVWCPGLAVIFPSLSTCASSSCSSPSSPPFGVRPCAF